MHPNTIENSSPRCHYYSYTLFNGPLTVFYHRPLGARMTATPDAEEYDVQLYHQYS